MKAKKGFTLVEILIVVVILGILAAIVIPQFTDASTSAKESGLRADIQTMRSQLELYKIQHNDLLPGQDTKGGAIAAADFLADLTSKTDQWGAVYVAGTSTTGPFGPYMQDMPKNPFVASGVEGASITIVNDDTATCGGGADAAWWLNAANGEFRAYTTGTITDGTSHFEL